MKLNKSFLLGLMAVAGLASCVSEDIQKGGETGTMMLKKVAAKEPATRASSDYTPEELAAMQKATNFPIEIYKKDGSLIKTYNAVSQFPSEGLALNTGDYYVEAHTPGLMEKKMTTPYYKGTEPFIIQTGNTTDVDVVCKMQNSKIQVTYSEEFLKVYSSWDITIDDHSDDGNGTVLSFSKDKEGENPAPYYWAFDEDVQTLTFQFKAILAADGAPVSYTTELTKENFQRPYDDDDSQAFCGGDQLVFNFDPSALTTGEIILNITATVTFEATNETETVYLTDKTLKEDEGDDPDTPTPPVSQEPSLECTGGWNVSFSADAEEDDLPHTEVVVNTPKGLKSLKVTVTGGNAGFAGATGFLQDLEIIGSEDLGEIFADVDGAELPKSGDKVYKFPVYAFFNMIQMFGATDAGKAHEFYMVAEDMDGTVKDGTLKITVTE